MTSATSSRQCWRLRHPIGTIAVAGTPVHIVGNHHDDDTELDVFVGRMRCTLPSYYLTPPPTAGWSTRTDTMTDQALLSVADARTYLGGIGRTYLYQLIASGDLTRVKVGQRAMITRESVDTYLEKIAKQSAAEA